MSKSGTNYMTGAEAMVRLLQGYGVSHIFGLCGDTTLPFYDALARLDHGLTHLLTRDERHGAYMADGFARVTGRPGVCEGPSGGGATYILPGVVEAQESSIALLSITTDVSTSSRGHYPLTELDQSALFAPLTKWNASIDDARQLPSLVRKAFRAMTTARPGAVHLAFPFDVQKDQVNEEDIWIDREHREFPAQRVSPDIEAVERAAQMLVKARNAVVICGGGPLIAGAFSQVLTLARMLNLPVATTISGQGIIAETDPHALGVVGSNGGVVSTREVVEEADIVLFIGCRAGSVTTERWRSPRSGARIIHIDIDPMVIGANYQTEVGIVGDAMLVLDQLINKLNNLNKGEGNRGTLRAKRAWEAKNDRFQALAHSEDSPIRPERVVATLNKVLDDDAIVVADPGTPCPYISAYYRWRKAGRHFISNRAHGALGYALGAAMGAHCGRPQVKTVALMGDGSFGFCCGELETLVRYNMPITIIVFSNAVYGWIKAGQDKGFDQRYYNVDFGRTDHAAVARAFGLRSWRVENPAELESALRQAIGHSGPTLVDIISQPLHEASAPVSEWVS